MVGHAGLLKTLTLKYLLWGAWVAQLVKHPTLDFGSGHDLIVHGIESYIGLCTDLMAWAYLGFSLSLSLPFPASMSLFLALSK